jgi:hypothetical protein
MNWDSLVSVAQQYETDYFNKQTQVQLEHRLKFVPVYDLSNQSYSTYFQIFFIGRMVSQVLSANMDLILNLITELTLFYHETGWAILTHYKFNIKFLYLIYNITLLVLSLCVHKYII